MKCRKKFGKKSKLKKTQAERGRKTERAALQSGTELKKGKKKGLVQKNLRMCAN